MEVSAGAILYTIINNEIYYLLIKDFHNNWGFAKGHIEKNETEKMAAIREIKEEVGIEAVIESDYKEELIYIMPNNIEKRSIYYIGKYRNQNPIKQDSEIQEIKLVKYSDALSLLSFENMKTTFKKAHQYIINNLYSSNKTT